MGRQAPRRPPPGLPGQVCRSDDLREEHSFLVDSTTSLVADAGGYRLWNFAGGRANNVLARSLEGILGERVTSSNLAVGFRESAAQSEVAIRQALDRLRLESRPNWDDAIHYAEGLDHVRLSKFQACLPPRLETEYLADLLTEVG